MRITRNNRKEPRFFAARSTIMKKILACLLCVMMICSMSVIAMPGVSAAGNELLKTYDKAVDGDLLYEVKFGQTDGCYVSNIISKDAASTATVTPSADGREVEVTVGAATSKRCWYGGLVNGLELGEGKKYTITLKIKSNNADPNSTGNDGFFFTCDPAAATYADSYGFYGNLSAESGPFLSLFKGGNKTFGDILSDGSSYFKIMDFLEFLPELDKDNFTNVAIEIDGYKYSVYLDAGKDGMKLFDTTTMTDVALAAAGEFSIIFYTYSSAGSLKDVNIYKGNNISTPVTTTAAPVTTAAPTTTAAPATTTTAAPATSAPVIDTPKTSDPAIITAGIAMAMTALTGFVASKKRK